MDKSKILEEFKEKIENLNTPVKIQDFLDKIPVNFEKECETCMSPKKVLEVKKAHCIEGAFFAAACIWINKIGNSRPLVVDMIGEKGDWDHVIAIFEKNGKFGAISKTNHAVLRYREPVYRDVRELVMSYFHEYTDDRGLGRKTLRKYSDAIDLSSFGKEWIVSEENLWHIHDYIDSVEHYDILEKGQEKELRRADEIEIKAGQLVEWKKE